MTSVTIITVHGLLVTSFPTFLPNRFASLGRRIFLPFFSSNSSIISSGRGTNGIKANHPSKAKITGSKVNAAKIGRASGRDKVRNEDILWKVEENEGQK